MTKIVLEIDGHEAWHIKNLRRIETRGLSVAEQATASFLADTIEAAQGKRYVVLDVDDLKLTGADLSFAIDVLNNELCEITANAVREMRRQMDSLTPPRPEEPKWGPIKADGRTWYRVGPNCPKDWVTFDVAGRPRWAWWSEIPDPIEVLSSGVGGARIGLGLEA